MREANESEEAERTQQKQKYATHLLDEQIAIPHAGYETKRKRIIFKENFERRQDQSSTVRFLPSGDIEGTSLPTREEATSTILAERTASSKDSAAL